jgi:hypothetical protein
MQNTNPPFILSCSCRPKPKKGRKNWHYLLPYSHKLEVSEPPAVTGGPIARSPVSVPGRAEIFWLRAGTGCPTKISRVAAARG